MGCMQSKNKKAAEANNFQELIPMTPTRASAREGNGSPRPLISLPIMAGYPIMYEHTGTGLPRPMTSAGVPNIPVISITQDVIVAEQDAPAANPGDTADQVGGDDAASKGVTTTTVEGGDKAVVTTPANKNDI
ncbi:hypothetical protein ACHAPT_000377 [Fusarium lateritium]